MHLIPHKRDLKPPLGKTHHGRHSSSHWSLIPYTHTHTHTHTLSLCAGKDPFPSMMNAPKKKNTNPESSSSEIPPPSSPASPASAPPPPYPRPNNTSRQRDSRHSSAVPTTSLMQCQLLHYCTAVQLLALAADATLKVGSPP